MCNHSIGGIGMLGMECTRRSADTSGEIDIEILWHAGKAFHRTDGSIEIGSATGGTWNAVHLLKMLLVEFLGGSWRIATEW